MQSQHFSLKYGKGTVEFDLPGEQVLQVLRGNNVAPPADLAAAYRQALANPIGTPALKEVVKPGETVCIAVSDITRGWQKNHLTVPILIDELNAAGVPDENITILIAVGAHRKNTDDEFLELCSPEVCHRVRVLNHDCWDEPNMVYKGTTPRGTRVTINRIAAEADRLILTGGVIYHYMVGFGGGRKSVIPGISSIETIRGNHLWAFDAREGHGSNPLAANAKTVGNPCHEDMMDIAAIVAPDFLVNVVPNLDGDICGIFAGHWETAWWEATKLVEHIYGVEIKAQADIVIATAGGYPKDINLYQSQKTIDNAVYAMKPGGVTICLAEIPLINDPQEFVDWFQHETLPELDKAVRANLLISGWVAVKQVEYGQMGTIILMTREGNDVVAKKAHTVPVHTMEDALKLAYESCGTDQPKIIIMPQGANTFPIFEGGQRG